MYESGKRKTIRRNQINRVNRAVPENSQARKVSVED
jgi:hypothetical protein